MNCSRRKLESTVLGITRTSTSTHDTIRTSVSARKNPVSGDSTIADAVLIAPAHTTATPPALATPAPIRPPISACELDDGIPPHQVIRFHAIAPIKAPKMTRASTTSAD